MNEEINTLNEKINFLQEEFEKLQKKNDVSMRTKEERQKTLDDLMASQDKTPVILSFVFCLFQYTNFLSTNQGDTWDNGEPLQNCWVNGVTSDGKKCFLNTKSKDHTFHVPIGFKVIFYF